MHTGKMQILLDILFLIRYHKNIQSKLYIFMVWTQKMHPGSDRLKIASLASGAADV